MALGHLERKAREDQEESLVLPDLSDLLEKECVYILNCFTDSLNDKEPHLMSPYVLFFARELQVTVDSLVRMV